MPLRALARVDLASIERNCSRLARLAAPAALCAVVKADGYGHGAGPAARAARAGGATWLAVATALEAAELRAAGLDGPILVLGALSDSELTVALRARADIVAWRERFAAGVAAHPDAGGTGVHVKLDTGMGRLGTRDADEATRTATVVASAPALRLAGAMTHFATADTDPAFAREQLARFEPWARELASRHDELLLHAANSAATLALPESRLGLVRCGIAVYGWTRSARIPAAMAWSPRSSCAPTSPRSSRSRPGRARATGAASSRRPRPGSAPCRSGTPTACVARSPTTAMC
jgi:alanine racemase